MKECTFILYKELKFLRKLKSNFSKDGIGDIEWVNNKLSVCESKLINSHDFFGLNDDKLNFMIRTYYRNYIVTGYIDRVIVNR